MKKLSFIMLIFVMMAGTLIPAIARAEDDTPEFKVDWFHKWDISSDKYDLTNKDGNLLGNFCAIKQADGHIVVWTADDLTTAEEWIIEQVVRANDHSIKDGDVFHFTADRVINGPEITGTDKTNWGIYNITTNENGVYVLTCDADKISHLDVGKYTRPVKEHGEWVEVYSTDDSCTGYGNSIGLKDTLVGKSWFMKQTLKADTDYNIDIIAGNPKNGANVVGALTVDQVDGKYQLSYNFDEQAQPANPSIGDEYTAVQINDAHYNYDGSGIAINKAPGKNLDLVNGVTFTPEVDVNNEYDLYAHFSIKVITYQYQMVPDVTE